jgi:pimeloyl-ACP methyl ester carboxylesterase
MPYANIRGARIHYVDEGSGRETIVFAHGLLWSHRMWDAQITALRDRYRCVAFDFRGQGRSETTAEGYGMDALALDTAELIEQLGAAPCHFVGLSMGGFIGLRLASRRPELLRSLSLVDTAADPEPRKNAPKYAAMALVARVLGFGPLLDRVMKIMFAEPFLTDPARAAEREEMRRRLLAVDVPGAVRSTMAVVTRRAVEAELGRVRTPTLVVHGAEDSAIVMPRARRMADAIAGARLCIVPRAGHTSSIEEPAAVTRALASFLDEQRAPSACASEGCES